MAEDMRGTLPFLVVAEEADVQDAMGGIFRRGDADVVVREIPLSILRNNLRTTIAAVRSLFEEVADQAGPVRLREVQIGLEVSASGGVQLIGTAQVGAKRAITLVFQQD